MDTRQIPQQIGDSASGWDKTLYAFLAEKERRSGSRRTVEGYSRMLQHFFGSVGKPPDRVTSQEVFARPLPDGRPTTRICTPPSDLQPRYASAGAGSTGSGAPSSRSTSLRSYSRRS